MSPQQVFAIECAALDLAYAVRCRRECEPMETTPLLDTLDDLRAAFPEMAESIDYILAEFELEEEA
jgi:hypothetical protein